MTTTPLRELAALFLKLGTISVGGPAAHIALMHDEVVRRRHWLTEQEFLDLVGATNVIPGPNSTELAIHIGRLRAGWAGLLVAGCCFILPAVVIVGAIAMLYVRSGALPEAQSVFHGLKPVVIAIVGVALWRLAATAIRSVSHALLAIAILAGLVAGLHELIALAAGAAIGGIVSRKDRATAAWIPAVSWPGLAAVASVPVISAVTLGKLFLVFLKAGAFLFGSGYVLLAFLRADLVTRLGWLTEQQLLDAIAVGQFTPGPVFTTATFIGYLLGGTSGALVATFAIFLPAFVYVALTGRIVSWVRRSPVAAGALDGVNIASLALMALVAWQLGRAAIVDLPTTTVAVASVVCLFAWRINAIWLLAAGAAAGWLRIV